MGSGGTEAAAFDPSGGSLAVAATSGVGLNIGTLTRYRVSAAGELTQAQAPLTIGSSTSSIEYSPDGTLAAVASWEDETVSLLKRSPDGDLSPVASVPAGFGNSSLAFSPDGSYLGVTEAAELRIFQFRVAPGPVLIPVGAPTPLSAGAVDVATATGGRIAVATQFPDGVQMWTLGASGELTRGTAIEASAVLKPSAVALTANGQRLAVAKGDNTLSTYTVSAAGVPTLADTKATGAGPVGVAFSANGSIVATVNRDGRSVSLFSVDANGILTARATAGTGDGPADLAFSPDGSLLLTADADSAQLSVFSVVGTSLTPKAPIATGGYPERLAFRPGGGQIATTDKWAGTMSTFSITPEGVATRTAEVGSPAGDISDATEIAYSPSGNLIATGEYPGTLEVFGVSASGSLTPIGDPTPIDEYTDALAFDATGRFLVIGQGFSGLWLYGLAAPSLETVVAVGPAPFDHQASPTFEFDASYPSTFECKVDGGLYAACPSTTSIPIEADGPHTLSVRAYDALGTVDPTPATRAWTSDRVAPSSPSLQSPADSATNLAPTLGLTWAPSSDATSQECATTSCSWTARPWPRSPPASARQRARRPSVRLRTEVTNGASA